MEIKLAVVGKRESIGCFRGAGIPVYDLESGAPLRPLVARLEKEGYGILFVTEELLTADPLARELMDDFREKPLPALIPIPGSGGSLGLGAADLHRQVERAVGTDLFQDE